MRFNPRASFPAVVASLLVSSVLVTDAASADTAGASSVEVSTALAAIGADAPDPALVEADGEWLVFTTNTESGNVPVWRLASVDAAVVGDASQLLGENSELLGDALPTLGSWAVAGSTWAPSVAYYGGRWLLYYTAHDADSGRQCIGVATSDVVVGPYVDTAGAPMVCQSDRGGSIDPSVLITGDGSAFLYWKSDDNAIGRRAVLWGARLSADGTGTSGASAALGRADRTWERSIVENPAMVHTASGYTLFYSGGQWWTDGYGTGYLSCTGPLGPCVKRTRGTPLWTSDASSTGQGGASMVVTGARSAVVAFHGWAGADVGYDDGGMRRTYIDTMSIERGRPQLA